MLTILFGVLQLSLLQHRLLTPRRLLLQSVESHRQRPKKIDSKLLWLSDLVDWLLLVLHERPQWCIEVLQMRTRRVIVIVALSPPVVSRCQNVRRHRLSAGADPFAGGCGAFICCGAELTNLLCHFALLPAWLARQ